MTNSEPRADGPAGPEPHGVRGRLRLAARITRFAGRSARRGDWDFVGNAVRAVVRIAIFSVMDVVPSSRRVICNLCGWSGRRFYPNTGPGFDEREAICPGCLASDRYRSLYEVVRHATSALSTASRVVEVAPLPSLEHVFLTNPLVDYTSFDLARHAMERGDITKMRFADDSVDWFICFHVLEHIPDEAAAIREIHRVLRPGGSAVLQVPMDWDAAATREYPAPDPRDVNHVRRHGLDFADRIEAYGFSVQRVDPLAVAGEDVRNHAGLSPEPIFLATATTP